MRFLTDLDEIKGATNKEVSKVRIGHVNVRVADLDRATDFYCNVLGMNVTCYGPTIGVPTVFLAFGDYHHHVALTWFYGDNPVGQRALNHFAIAYPDALSLAEAASRVLECGELIEDARDHGGTVSVYLRDPDGNGIELYYDRPRSRWFDVWGQLIVDSEPFNLKAWLNDVLDRHPEAIFRPTNFKVPEFNHDGNHHAIPTPSMAGLPSNP